MSPSLDPACTLDRFVIGPSNRVAASAALRAADAPGRIYNPLVISGPAGVGKTHLLMAVGHRARRLDPELIVHYETAESFVDRVTENLARGRLDEFRAATAGVDLLLLDGLDRIAGRARTEEELLRLIGELVAKRGQVVVAADLPPGEIAGLHSGLVARLAGGLNVEISPPDLTTRLSLLRRLTAELGYDPNPEVVTALAELPIADVRALRQAVSRVMASAELEGREAGPEDVKRLTAVSSMGDGDGAGEFEDFLSDISNAVATVVETAPWRRRLAEAILRWEGEGIRTRRLEAALDADSAPDVDALLAAFGRDVARLRRIAAELPVDAVSDPTLLRDPDRLPEAERLLSGARPDPHPPGVGAGAPVAGPDRMLEAGRVDRWFLDREKLAWDWLALDDRLVEEQR